MAWYRTGTVAVTLNSATVTGTSTSFSANARVGDGFLGPDGRWYEVTNIASATVLSITPNYIGATASGQTYAIAPLQGYNLESATKMRTIIDSWGTTLSVLGAASTTAQIRTNIGAAASGLNADITRLNGLTTAITVAQGGTGATSATTARTNLGLGTVATLAVTGTQSAGAAWDLPTTSVPRVSESVYAARQGYGLYISNAAVVNIDNEPGGACGLYATTNTNGGTYPTTSLGFAWIETQQTYGVGSRMQHAYSYAGSATSGSLLNPISWLRVSNYPGTAWGRWCQIYNQSNIVGTVSGTSTTPTGAIIERGTNTNGEYTKFADGTMICFRSGQVTTTGIGSVTWTFPAAFSSIPTYVNLTLEPGDTYDVRNYVTASQYQGTSTTQTKFTTYCASAVGSKSFAIGRWAA